jgi:hypothetical protein
MVSLLAGILCQEPQYQIAIPLEKDVFPAITSPILEQEVTTVHPSPSNASVKSAFIRK